MAAKIQEAVESSQFAMATAQSRSNALVYLRWDGESMPGVHQIWIYNTNGTRLMTVASNYNNCVIRGFRDGEVRSFYAVAVNSDLDGEQSNIAIGTASVRVPWIVPSELPYARTFTWKCAPGVTNILQSSSNLTTWTTASRFRGTNGTAVVTLTNQLPFHRVLVLNATNVPPMTLTQQISFVELSWPGDGKTNVLERMADLRTESYLPVSTNSGVGRVAVIRPWTGGRHRVIRQ